MKKKYLNILLWIFLFPIMISIYIWKNEKIDKKFKLPLIISIIVLTIIISLISSSNESELKNEIINKCYTEQTINKLEKLYGIENINGNFASNMECKNLEIENSNYKRIIVEEKDNKLIGIKVKDSETYKYIYYIDKSYDIYDSKTLKLKEKADEKLVVEREAKEKAKLEAEKEARENKIFTDLGFSLEESKTIFNVLKSCDINKVDDLKKYKSTENVNAYKFNSSGYEYIIFFADNKVNTITSGDLTVYNNGNIKKIQDYTLSSSEMSNLKTISEEYVKAQLKSPSTAEFPGKLLSPYEDWKMEQAGVIYKISSYVDSQNSFGAMIRTYFYIQLEFDNSGNLKVTKFETQ